MTQLAQTQALLIADFADNSAGLILAEYSRNLVLSSMGVVLSRAPSVTDDAVDTAGTGNFFDAGNKWIDDATNRSYVCISGATGAAIWQAEMYDGQAAGGDLGSTFPNPNVVGLHFGTHAVPLALAAPSVGDVLTWSGSAAGWSSLFVLRNYLDGFQCGNVSAPSLELSVAPGQSADSTNVVTIRQPFTFYKTLASAWSAGVGSSGSPVGGLDSGSVAASTWYNVFVISKADGTADVIFSTASSSIGPSLPTGFLYWRRVWSIYTRLISAIFEFDQWGDLCLWVTPPLVYNSSGVGTAPINVTTLCPLGFPTLSIHSGYAIKSGAQVVIGIYAPGTTQDLSSSFSSAEGVADALSTRACFGAVLALTNASSQVAAQSSQASTTLNLGCQGYVDPRRQTVLGKEVPWSISAKT